MVLAKERPWKSHHKATERCATCGVPIERRVDHWVHVADHPVVYADAAGRCMVCQLPTKTRQIAGRGHAFDHVAVPPEPVA